MKIIQTQAYLQKTSGQDDFAPTGQPYWSALKTRPKPSDIGPPRKGYIPTSVDRDEQKKEWEKENRQVRTRNKNETESKINQLVDELGGFDQIKSSLVNKKVYYKGYEGFVQRIGIKNNRDWGNIIIKFIDAPWEVKNEAHSELTWRVDSDGSPLKKIWSEWSRQLMQQDSIEIPADAGANIS